jgi:hypothetical protein
MFLARNRRLLVGWQSLENCRIQRLTAKDAKSAKECGEELNHDGTTGTTEET